MYPESVFRNFRKYLLSIGILAALFITVFSVIWIYQVNQPKEVVFVHNGKSEKIITKAKTIDQFLQEQHVQIDSFDVVYPDKNQRVKNGLEVKYTDKWQIMIQEGDRQQSVITDKKSVQAILEDHQISLGELDRVEPELTEELQPNQTVSITRVEKKVVETEEDIPYKEISRKDYALTQGQKKVIQEGQHGKALQSYEVVLENGKEISRKLVGTKVIQPKQDRVIAVGSLVTVSRGGTTFTPRKVINNVTLTAYAAGVSHTGKDVGHPAYAITASGKRAQEGRTIAVDPKVIPLGTWVYIEGIGFRRAEDTGGAVKGNKIDVFYEDDRTATNFGLRKSKAVYVLGRNKPE